MDLADLHWLVGLIEGEGTFCINIAMRYGGGFAVGPVFSLSLVEKDKNTIEFIHKTLGFGKIRFKSKEIWAKRGMTNPQNQYAFLIDNLDDALKFIELFDENLFRSAKKKDYILWKEGVEIINNFNHLTHDGFMRICEIRDSMNLKIKRKNYKNKKWFEEFLSENKNFFSKKNVMKRKKTSLAIRKLNKLITGSKI